jgi:hypothetical protein
MYNIMRVTQSHKRTFRKRVSGKVQMVKYHIHDGRKANRDATLLEKAMVHNPGVDLPQPIAGVKVIDTPNTAMTPSVKEVIPVVGGARAPVGKDNKKMILGEIRNALSVLGKRNVTGGAIMPL